MVQELWLLLVLFFILNYEQYNIYFSLYFVFLIFYSLTTFCKTPDLNYIFSAK